MLLEMRSKNFTQNGKSLFRSSTYLGTALSSIPVLILLTLSDNRRSDLTITSIHVLRMHQNTHITYTTLRIHRTLYWFPILRNHELYRYTHELL